MFESHYVFTPPDDESTKIWRYMDFTKFVSLIDRQALFFTRMDRLDDRFEGSIPKPSFFDWTGQQLPANEILVENMKRIQPLYKMLKKQAAINCWHMNEHESAAMWKLYLQSSDGIAVQSTYRKLLDCFLKDERYKIWIGKVKYIDYNVDPIPADNLLFPLIHKRKSFEHEKELRVVTTKNLQAKNYPDQIFIGGPEILELPEEGVYLSVNVDVLIEKVFVSPACEKWFEDLVRSIMQKYAVNKEVKRSSLEDDPLF